MSYSLQVLSTRLHNESTRVILKTGERALVTERTGLGTVAVPAPTRSERRSPTYSVSTKYCILLLADLAFEVNINPPSTVTQIHRRHESTALSTATEGRPSSISNPIWPINSWVVIYVDLICRRTRPGTGIHEQDHTDGALLLCSNCWYPTPSVRDSVSCPGRSVGPRWLSENSRGRQEPAVRSVRMGAVAILVFETGLRGGWGVVSVGVRSSIEVGSGRSGR